jgi:hypothetical protein
MLRIGEPKVSCQAPESTGLFPRVGFSGYRRLNIEEAVNAYEKVS